MSRINAYKSLSGKLSRAGGLTDQLNASALYKPYTGAYSVIPQAGNAQTLKTANKILLNDIEVLEIPYFETTNAANGMTVYIAKEV